MSKRKHGRHRKGGRTTPKGTPPTATGRPRHWEPDPGPYDPGPYDGGSRGSDDDPFVAFRHAFAADHPLELLVQASSIAWLLDPSSVDPRQRARGAEPMPSADFLDALEGIDDPGTTAALGGLGVLLHDELTRARCRRAARRRRWSAPDWFAVLDQAVVSRTAELADHLGDGGNVYVEVQWPTGHVATVLAYIDHNMGSLVKDAFIVDDSIDALWRISKDAGAEAGGRFGDLDPAVACGRLVEGLDVYNHTLDAPESDSWPMAQPLVSWMIRLLPDPTPPAHQEPDQEQVQELLGAFRSSPYGAALDDVDQVAIEAIGWYGSAYGSGDPWRWGAPRLELFLLDFVVRKVVAPTDQLRRVPAVLRAFVRWAHAEVGVAPHLTDDSLEAIDRWTPPYLALIDGEAGVGFGWDDDDGDDFDDWGPYADEDWETSSARWRWEHAVAKAGSAQALEALDVDPLPDEPLDVQSLAPDIRDRVAGIAARCDRAADEHFDDVELRTAFRRLLRDVALADPQIFRRRSNDDNAAAAVCWLVAKANGLLHHGDTGPVLSFLGVSSTPTQRARTMTNALGVEFSTYRPWLGNADYLIQDVRLGMAEARDRWHVLDPD